MSEAQRLQQLEERVAWLQKHLVEQDKVMLELGDELARLRALVGNLHTRLTDAGDTAPASPASERPPHY